VVALESNNIRKETTKRVQTIQSTINTEFGNEEKFIAL
jgi:hypothetical protein